MYDRLLLLFRSWNNSATSRFKMFQLNFSIYCKMNSGSVFLICSFPGNFENCMFLLDSLKVFFLFILFSFNKWTLLGNLRYCGYTGALGCSMSKWSSLYSPGDRHGCKKFCFIFPGREKQQYISAALLWKLHRYRFFERERGDIYITHSAYTGPQLKPFEPNQQFVMIRILLLSTDFSLMLQNVPSLRRQAPRKGST